jgi:hypothetical protein
MTLTDKEKIKEALKYIDAVIRIKEKYTMPKGTEYLVQDLNRLKKILEQ